MQNYIPGPLGFDLSFYQDDDKTPQGIDFNKMRDYGAKFVIVRAGQNSWKDPDFETNWKAAREAGLPRASYWFYDPRVSPEVQANLWASVISNDPPEGRLWVDLEFPAVWGGDFTHWKYWKLFIQEVQQFTDQRIGIYTANYWWDPFAVQKGADLAYFSQFPLWVAQYTSHFANVIIPKGWDRAMIWQYGTPTIGKQAGVESEEIDADQWNNTFKFEDEWSGMSVPTTPGGSAMKYLVVWPNGVARRKGPTVFNTYTGQSYPYNLTVDVVENNIPDQDDPTNPNKRWVKFSDGLYGAALYPDSNGTPQTRMESIDTPVPPPTTTAKIAKAVIYDDLGNVITTLYPKV